MARIRVVPQLAVAVDRARPQRDDVTTADAQHVSQPVFARTLDVSKNLVSDWERGAKKPGEPAIRLLSIIQRKGLKAVA